MGQIQNAINQVFTSALHTAVAYKHSPYGQAETELKGIRTREGQIEQELQSLTGDPWKDKDLPSGYKHYATDTSLTPEQAVEKEFRREAKDPTELPGLTPKTIKERQAERQKMVDEGVASYKERSAPLYDEMMSLTKKYNVNASRANLPMRNEGDVITARRQAEENLLNQLTEAYMSKQGLAGAIKAKRELLGGLNNG